MLDDKNVMIMSKEEFRRDWNLIDKYNSVIFDEAHYFAGIKSQMSKSALKYLKKHQIKNVLGLTATPYLSSPMNIYVLGQIMGKGKEYEWSYQWFMQNFYDQVWMGQRQVPVVKKGIDHKLKMKIREISDIVDMKDCVDLPEDNTEVEYFDMTTDQKKAIKNLKDIQHITRWTKTHQICGGHLKGDAYNPDTEVKADKLTRVLELVAENRKSIVVCRYVGEIEMIEREIVQSSDEALQNKKVIVITGDVKDKQKVIDEANDASDCVILVSAACSEGWEAPTFPTMIFYSYDFSLKNHIQMRGRIQRINAVQQCNYVSLIVKDSIDHDVYKNVVEKKMDFHLDMYREDEIKADDLSDHYIANGWKPYKDGITLAFTTTNGTSPRFLIKKDNNGNQWVKEA